MKIYVAGPMTRMAEWNYPAFNAAAAELRAAGHEVVNPAEMGERYGTADEINADPQKFADMILEELDALATCDAIYLLPGWEKSPGTRRELEVALDHKLEIIVAPVENKGGVKRSIEVVVSKKETTTHGNVAALREALESFMVGSCVYPCVEMHGYDEDDEMCMDCTASPKKYGDCPYEKAKTALSTPPRNCDRFKTWEEAGSAWEKEGLHLPLLKWLFSPAKEWGIE